MIVLSQAIIVDWVVFVLFVPNRGWFCKVLGDDVWQGGVQLAKNDDKIHPGAFLCRQIRALGQRDTCSRQIVQSAVEEVNLKMQRYLGKPVNLTCNTESQSHSHLLELNMSHQAQP